MGYANGVTVRLRQLPAVNNPTFLRLRHSLRQVLMDLLFSVGLLFLFIFYEISSPARNDPRPDLRTTRH